MESGMQHSNLAYKLIYGGIDLQVYKKLDLSKYDRWSIRINCFRNIVYSRKV